MKTSKRLFTLMALALAFALTLTACGNQSDGDSKDAAFDDAYAVADVTLCGTNTNDASFMKGFSMQGTAGDLINNENVFRKLLSCRYKLNTHLIPLYYGLGKQRYFSKNAHDHCRVPIIFRLTLMLSVN